MPEPARFVERFALVLTEAGMARMPARVFACVLAAEDGRLTAAQLAERLQVSPAAISGATRYLQQVQMLLRDREPGERRDHFRLADDLWYEAYANRGEMLQRWIDTLTRGLADVGPNAAARIEDSRAFFAFLQAELPALMERWRAQRDAGS